MAYSTIPEEPSADDSLLPKPKTNLKRLAGGAAVASFVLGILAATAIASAGESRSAAFSAVDSAHHVITGNTQIKLLSDPTKCLAVDNHNSAAPGNKIVMYDCNKKWAKKDEGQAFTYTAGKITYGDYCLRVQPGPEEGGVVGLWWCDDGSDEQTFVWDKTGSKHISTPYNGHHLCLDNSGATANGSPITAQDCSSKALAQQAFTMSDGPAPPKTPAPTSAPATLIEIPVALVDCPEDAEDTANTCTRENELCACSESYGNCPTDYSSYDVCRMVKEDACADDASWTSESAGTCAAIAKMPTNYETGSTAEGDGFVLTSREKACAARGANGKYGFEACQRSCATCLGSDEVCKSSDPTWAFEGVKRLNCDWVAEKRERCTESGILMEEFEESEDDEDPNKPGPVEAYAFRACGKACGTCE